MKKFKKLLIGICTTALCLESIGMPVAAKSKKSTEEYYNYTLDSYTQSSRSNNAKYTQDQAKALFEQCRVTSENLNDWYEDTGIKRKAKEYLNDKENYYVGNLRYLTDFGLCSLSCDNGKKAFNYGIVIMDEPICPSYMKVICKCSDSDLKELNDRGNSNFFYEYDSKSDILTATLIRYVRVGI